MNIFDFENKVRSASNNQKLDLDMDGLLSDLNLGNNSPKRRIAFLPYFGVFALALTGALMYFTYSFNFEDTPLQTAATSTAAEVKLTATNAKHNEVKSFENESNDKGSTKVNTIATDKLKNSTDVNKAKAQTKESVASITESSITRTNDNTNRTSETIPTSRIINEEIINSSPIQNARTTLFKADKILPNNANPKQAINVTQNTVAKQTNQVARAETILALPQLSILLDNDFAGKGLLPSNKKVSDCPKFSEGNWNLAIVPEVGILVPIKSLSVKNESVNDIFDDRKRNESSQISYQTGIGIQFRNKITGLYIKPGFNYSIINETFTNEDTRFITNEVKYQLRQFNIPIAIGTSFKQKKVSFDIEGGIIFNFLQKTNGRLFNGGDDFILLDGDQAFFKESTGLGFFAGAAIKTQVSNNSEIYLGTRFNFNTLSTSSNLNPIDQRYSFIGIHAGVIYTLF